MNKLAYYTGYMDKEARRGRPRFDAMIAAGDLPDDFNPSIGNERVERMKSSLEKSWCKGMERFKREVPQAE